MKITRRQLRRIINETCAALDSGGCPACIQGMSCPCKDRHTGVNELPGKEHVDVDWESPEYGSARGNIDDMSPQEAFALGFSMGQSWDFADALGDDDGLEGAWSGGANLVSPRDYVGELEHSAMVREGVNHAKVTRKRLRQIISEEIDEIAIRPRIRGQHDAAGFTSGLYEDDVSEDKSGKGKCPKSGCITQRDDKWRIISNKTGKLWPQTYDSKGDAEDALQAYHAGR